MIVCIVYVFEFLEEKIVYKLQCRFVCKLLFKIEFNVKLINNKTVFSPFSHMYFNESNKKTLNSHI